ncbi:MAG: hypothetical protein M1835_005226 [Candelina submexicana]|nr:MAG: hypothetical protein M1835_005226 [Candelina submexicana]
MATQVANMTAPSSPVQQVIEQIWQVVARQFTPTNPEIVVPSNFREFIGQSGVDTISQRFSALIGGPVTIIEDSTIKAIRMQPASPLAGGHATSIGPAGAQPPQAAAEVASNSPVVPRVGQKDRHSKVKAANKHDKVPRPPNAFILYRQHHHPLLKASNPGLHNNQISVILGNQWKNETDETKIHFQSLAETIKRQHYKDHPEYQYQPRKPSERKRRMTRRKAAALAETVQPSTTSTPSDFSIGFGISSDSDLSSAPTPSTVPEAVVEVPTFETTPSGELTTTLPDYERDFAAMLTEYNRTVNGPANIHPTIPGPPVTSATPLETAGEESFMDLFDWEQVERDNEEASQLIEQEYEAEHAAPMFNLSPFQEETLWDRAQENLAGAEYQREIAGVYLA